MERLWRVESSPRLNGHSNLRYHYDCDRLLIRKDPTAWDFQKEKPFSLQPNIQYYSHYSWSHFFQENVECMVPRGPAWSGLTCLRTNTRTARNATHSCTMKWRSNLNEFGKCFLQLALYILLPSINENRYPYTANGNDPVMFIRDPYYYHIAAHPRTWPRKRPSLQSALINE